MSNPAVSTAAKRAEAHEASARPIGLADQSRTVVASSTFEALLATRDELRRELDAALERVHKAEAVARQTPPLSPVESEEERDQRIDRSLALGFLQKAVTHLFCDEPLKAVEYVERAVRTLDRVLDRDRRVLVSHTELHTLRKLRASTESDRSDLEAALSHLDHSDEAFCPTEGCEHVRPRGWGLCVDCDTNRDQRGV